MALEAQQLADIRQGIVDRHLSIVFGPPPHWFALDAQPNPDGLWVVTIRIRHRKMRRGDITEEAIEAVLIEALEMTVNMSRGEPN